MFSGLSSGEESQGGLYSVASRHGCSTWGVPIRSGSDVLEGPGADHVSSKLLFPDLSSVCLKLGSFFSRRQWSEEA